MKASQDASGAHVDIDPECEPGKTTRKITIRGQPQQCVQCFLLLRQALQRSKAAQEAVTTSTTTIPNDGVGRLIGKQGQTLKQLQDMSGMFVF